MFWFLVFLAVAGTLAYRATPLPTATGVLGVTVLLYGWLGESAGYFLLLLLAWLLLFVPLNATALRQEWFSRPLLERWRELHRDEPVALPDPGPAAALLEGDVGGLPQPAAGAEPVDAALRSEALAAALLQRLRSPLQPAEPEVAQARVAESLYTAAALCAQQPRLLAREQPDSGQLLRATLAWPLAKQAAVLRGLATEASLDWAALDPAPALAARLALAHRPGRALRQAAQLESPAARLVAFDAAFWPLPGRLLSALLRSFIGSFAAALPATGDDAVHARQQRLRLSAQRLAALVGLRNLLPLFTPLPAAYELALARALMSLLAMHAALAWHGEAQQAGGERPLLESLLRGQQHALEQSLAAALRELPHPLWRSLLRCVVLPLPLARPATASESRAAAEALLRESSLRARLIDGLPSQDALLALDARIQALHRLEPSLRRLQLARFETPPADDAALLAAASRLGLLSDEESATLSEALAFAASQETA